MPLRPSVFGPTRGAAPVQRPSMLDQLASPQSTAPATEVEEPVSALSRLPGAPQEQFQPIEEPETTGEGPMAEGPEGPTLPRDLPSVEYLTPSQERRRSLIDRLSGFAEEQAEKAEPTEAQEILGDITTGVKTGKAAGQAGEKGAKLFERLMRDAGFTQEAIQSLLPELQLSLTGAGGQGLVEAGGALDPAKFSLGGGESTALDALSAGTDASMLGAEGGAGLTSQLGAYAPYVSAILGALQIAQTATGNMQDDQKAVQSAAQALTAALATAGAAGSTAAGTFAGPVALILSAIARHFMHEMQDIPHEVREYDEAERANPQVQRFRQELDESTNPQQLMDILADWTTAKQQYGTDRSGQRMAFIPQFGGGGERGDMGGRPVFGPGGATLDMLLQNPSGFFLQPQLGVSEDYKDPWRANLSNLVRNRLALFARAKQGDPAALASMRLLQARVGAAQQSRQREAEAQRQRERDLYYNNFTVG